MPKRKLVTPLKNGAVYQKQFKGETHVLTVVRNGAETVYKVKKDTYKTPTAAAKSITGYEVNGWRFWKIG